MTSSPPSARSRWRAKPWLLGSKLIRGKAGTAVTLTISRGGNTRSVTMTRADVTVPVAASKLLHYKGKTLGYLQFTQFTEGLGRGAATCRSRRC